MRSNEYVILDNQLRRVGLLSNSVRAGTPFWGDTIDQSIAEDDSGFAWEDLKDTFNTINLASNKKTYDHQITGITIPSNGPDAQYIVAGNHLMYYDDENKHYYIMRIINVDETAKDTEFQFTFDASNLAEWKLSRTIPLAFQSDDVNAKTVFTNLLAKSGWRLEFNSTSNITLKEEFDGTSSAQSYLQQLAADYDVEIDCYAELDQVGDVTGLVVEVSDHLGSKSVQRLDYRNDLTGVERKLVDDALVSKLYVLGADGATIEDANDGKAFITDPDANAKYNHDVKGTGSTWLEGTITSDTIQNSSGLLAWGKKQLAMYNHPRYNYTVSIRSDIKGGIGDNFRIADFALNPPLLVDARVIKVTKSLSDPSVHSLTLGEYSTISPRKGTDDLKVIDDLRDQIEKAKDDASKAQSDAQNAQDAANDAADKADDANKNANDANKNANDANKTANDANNKIDGLQIGGRNYVLNTGVGFAGVGNGGSNQYPAGLIGIGINTDILGKPITVQFKAEISNYKGGSFLRLKTHDATGIWGSAGEINNISADGTFYCQWKGTLPAFVKDGKPTIGFNTDLNANISVFLLRMNSGNVYQDWYPAPEDVKNETDQANSNANDAKNSADTANKAANDANNKIDNLQVGARNYLLNSAFLGTSSWSVGPWKVDESTTFNGLPVVTANPATPYTGGASNSISQTGLKIQPNTKVTISVWAKASKDGANFRSEAWGGITPLKNTITTEWKRYSYETSILATPQVYFFAVDANTQYWISQPKVEIGNLVTDWTPAPEDDQAAISKAQSDAQKAQDAANSASSKADDANKAANNAASTANDAKNSADSATNTANGANKTANDAKNSANDANNKIDGLQVGGRNYILKSSESISLTGQNKANQNSGDSAPYRFSCGTLDKVPLSDKQTVVLSVDYKITGDKPTGTAYFGFNTATLWEVGVIKIPDISKVAATGRIYAVVSSDKIKSTPATTIRMRLDYVPANVKVEFANPKLEIATKPSDWTPAPEDVNNKIDGMEIGGQNYIRNGNLADLTGKYWRDWNGAAGATRAINAAGDDWPANTPGVMKLVNPNGAQWGYAQDNIKVDGNADYVVSALVQGDAGTVVSLQHGNGGTDLWEVKDFKLPGGKTRIVFGFKTGSAAKSTNIYVGFGNNGKGTAWISQIKLERGNKATDWTPSPLDVDDANKKAQQAADDAKSNSLIAQDNVNEIRKTYFADNVYFQKDKPTDAKDGAIWFQTKDNLNWLNYHDDTSSSNPENGESHEVTVTVHVPNDGKVVAASGSFTWNSQQPITTKPSLAAHVSAYTYSGLSATYRGKTIADSTLWIFYTSYAGSTVYVPVKDMKSGKRYGTDSNAASDIPPYHDEQQTIVVGGGTQEVHHTEVIDRVGVEFACSGKFYKTTDATGIYTAPHSANKSYNFTATASNPLYYSGKIYSEKWLWIVFNSGGTKMYAPAYQWNGSQDLSGVTILANGVDTNSAGNLVSHEEKDVVEIVPVQDTTADNDTQIEINAENVESVSQLSGTTWTSIPFQKQVIGASLAGASIDSPLISLGDDGALWSSYNYSQMPTWFQPIQAIGTVAMAKGELVVTGQTKHYVKGQWGYYDSTQTFRADDSTNYTTTIVNAGGIKNEIQTADRNNLIARTALDGNGFVTTTGERGNITNSITNKQFLSNAIYNSTTGDGANVNISSTGVLKRSTSATKYKLDITDYDTALAKGYDLIEKINPKMWFDKGQVERYAKSLSDGSTADPDDKVNRVYGLIAEDLEAAGLHEFITRGQNDEIEGIDYAKLWTLLIPVTKDLNDRLTKLENK